jgi:hypothetical protein
MRPRQVRADAGVVVDAGGRLNEVQARCVTVDSAEVFRSAASLGTFYEYSVRQPASRVTVCTHTFCCHFRKLDLRWLQQTVRATSRRRVYENGN